MGRTEWLVARVGALLVFLILLGMGWQYRTSVRNAYRAFVGDLPPGGFRPTGYPSGPALRSAREKQIVISRRRGPELVTFSASEIASLVEAQLDSMARAALDSVSVTLEEDRFRLDAQLLTEVWGRETLGPFAGLLAPREPLRVGGPARIERPGVVAWQPDEFVIKSVPFPRTFVSFVVNSLTGGNDGILRVAAPGTVGRIAITRDSVTFYRQSH